ncbi:RHS repeat-associated core domain-containing protein [Pelistega ratti]|uniref:RHS repeat-associated core domain-containing protein n=1 Tax=Pelistega ratti TaxID=2652177 RepID=UPI001FAA66FC|nr:RHS repeat-associated core domain-containing protein [Pelistega ratti]
MKYIWWGLFVFLIVNNTVAQEVKTCLAAKTGNPCAYHAFEPKLNLGVGNPIHLMSGNKFQQEEDVLMRPSGLEMTRYYNAMATVANPMGAGWTHSYSTHLYPFSHAWQIVLDDGQRILFSSPKNGKAVAQNTNEGYIQQNTQGNWEWHRPEGSLRVFNAQGYLIELALFGFPKVYIDYQLLDGKPYISRVFNEQETLTFHYALQGQHYVLKQVESPVGIFSYQYDIPTDFSATRLLKVVRADKWQREYLYEEIHQAGDPYRLTGIHLITPESKILRLNEWHYQADGKAIYSYTTLVDEALTIDYQQEATQNNTHSLTVVTDKEGQQTFIKGVMKAGQYLLEEVSGVGCYLCPQVGTKASYNAQGQLSYINGFSIYRDQQANVKSIDFEHPTWGKTTIFYHSNGMPIEWENVLTGKKKVGFQHSILLEENKDNVAQPFVKLEEDKLIFKNNLYLKQNNKNFQDRHLILEKAGKPIWTQQRQYSPEGILLAEKIIFHEMNKTVYQQYSYDNKIRLIVGLQNIYDGVDSEKLYIPNQKKVVPNKGEQQVFNTVDVSELSAHTTSINNKSTVETKEKVQVEEPPQHTKPIASHTFYYAWQREGNSAAYAIDGKTEKPVVYHPQKERIIEVNNLRLHYQIMQRTISVEEGKLGDKQKGAVIRDRENTQEDKNNRTEANANLTDSSYTLWRIDSVKKGNELIAKYDYEGGIRTKKTLKDKVIYFKYKENKLVEEIIERQGKVSLKRHYYYSGIMPIAFTEEVISLSEREDTVFGKRIKENNVSTQGKNEEGIVEHQDTLKVFYIHNDHLGQPFLVSDEQQNIQWAAYYSPMGEATIIKENIEFNLRQPGQYYDVETQLHDNYFRTYDPKAGHYLEPDPLGPTLTNDPYGYVAQQPRHFIDPLGLEYINWLEQELDWTSHLEVVE